MPRGLALSNRGPFHTKKKYTGYDSIRPGVFFVDEVNKTRRFLGLSLLTTKERNCLRCDKKFISVGSNNRMCGCTKE